MGSRFNTSHLVGGGAERGGYGGGEAVPSRGLLAKPLPAVRGDGVVLRAPAVVALPPLGVDQPLRLEPVQRGIERSLRNLERVPRYLPDPEQHPVAVQRLQGHRLQDEHVERSRQQLRIWI